MCIGIPMQIVEISETHCRCRRGDREDLIEDVDTSLVGPQPIGTWLLVFLGAAREVLDPDRAYDMSQALRGLAAVAAGEDFESFFADLIEREPELPPHLRPKNAGADTSPKGGKP